MDAYYVENFAAGSLTHCCTHNYLWTVDLIIHIFQQNEPIYGHHKLITNIMRQEINALTSP